LDIRRVRASVAGGAILVTITKIKTITKMIFFITKISLVAGLFVVIVLGVVLGVIVGALMLVPVLAYFKRYVSPLSARQHYGGTTKLTE